MVAEGFPRQIGIASGLIGAIGSVGGFVFPVVLSGLKAVTGSYDAGLWFFAGLGVCAWGMVFLRLRGDAVAGGEGAP
jgi:NNP family nitrate/nitrite transporter-like MFS transporter